MLLGNYDTVIGPKDWSISHCHGYYLRNITVLKMSKAVYELYLKSKKMNSAWSRI